jgi:hypothetical protein
MVAGPDDDTPPAPPCPLLLAAQKSDVATVRYQVCRLMRMLVEITNTLDKIPDEVGRPGAGAGGQR